MINYFYYLASRWYVAVPICLIFLTVSCATDDTPAPVVNKAQSWTGEEIFRGIYLLDGPVASEISTYAKIQDKYEFEKKPEIKQELSKLGDQFVLAIQEKDPAFFNNFKRSIQSGDQFKVIEALEQGTEMLQYAIKQDKELNQSFEKGMELAAKIDIQSVTDAQGNFDDEKLQKIAKDYLEAGAQNDETNSMRMAACSIVGVCAAWVILAVAQTVAAAVNYAAAVNVAAWAFAWVKTVGPKQARDSNPRELNLQREMLIQEITNNFAVVTP